MMRSLTLAVLLGLVCAGTSLASPVTFGDEVPVPRMSVAASYSCTPRRTCTKIRSCDEAVWYFRNCSWGGRLDRDKDGIPCENLCG